MPQVLSHIRIRQALRPNWAVETVINDFRSRAGDGLRTEHFLSLGNEVAGIFDIVDMKMNPVPRTCLDDRGVARCLEYWVHKAASAGYYCCVTSMSAEDQNNRWGCWNTPRLMYGVVARQKDFQPLLQNGVCDGMAFPIPYR
jgi:hypothetical protein